MTNEELQATNAFLSNQVRMLSEQYASTVASFNDEHGKIVGSLNNRVQELEKILVARSNEVSELEALADELRAQRERFLTQSAAAAPIPAGEVLEGSTAD